MTTDDIHSCSHLCSRPACLAIREAVAAEREACAAIADRYHVPMCDTFADAIAQDIRERGKL